MPPVLLSALNIARPAAAVKGEGERCRRLGYDFFTNCKEYLTELRKEIMIMIIA